MNKLMCIGVGVIVGVLLKLGYDKYIVKGASIV